jgi:hypothetical protein
VALRDVLVRKRRAYARAFAGQDGKVVLADLARFCHAQRTTFVPGDPNGSAQLEGRRQVFIRIREFVDMTEVEIRRYADALEQTEEIEE